MISFSDAYNHVLDHSQDYGTESVALKKAVGRVLAVDIYADRDFPPFNRATKDGIAMPLKTVGRHLTLKQPLQQVKGLINFWKRIIV